MCMRIKLHSHKVAVRIYLVMVYMFIWLYISGLYLSNWISGNKRELIYGIQVFGLSVEQIFSLLHVVLVHSSSGAGSICIRDIIISVE